MALTDIVANNPPSVDVTPDLKAVSAARNGREVVTLVTSPATYLHTAMVEPFFEQLERIGPQKELDLFLSTNGGQTEVPPSLVSIIRDFTEHLGVLLPFRAMSGGCHVALAGEELVMGSLSALGSVDPARKHHLLPNPNEPHSVQDLKHCVEFVNSQWLSGDGEGEHDEARATSIGAVLRELFQHVHPLAVGALEQSFELARLVTEKVLLSRSDFKQGDPRVEKIKEKLAGKYFSHSFLIHRRDVRDDLGLPVTDPTPALWTAMRALYKSYEAIAKSPIALANNQKLVYVAFMDTTSKRCVLARMIDESGKAVGEEWILLP